MADTAIEWTDTTWNPTTGCDRVSPGCDNCYALTMAKRLKGMGQAKYQRDGDPRTSGPGFALTVHPDTVNLPLTWRKPRKVFVNSMSDLFHDKVPTGWLADIFAVMAATPEHTYQILTKRHARMRSVLADPQFADTVADYAFGKVVDGSRRTTWPLPNVWLGVSVEDQHWADIRVPALLGTPAAVRFLSCEPLLGPVDLTRVSWQRGSITHLDAINGLYGVPGAWKTEGKRVDWVIVGGESGKGARRMDLAWAVSLVEQCRAAGVPVFVKQLGAAHGLPHDRKAGDPYWWPKGLQVREYPREVPA